MFPGVPEPVTDGLNLAINPNFSADFNLEGPERYGSILEFVRGAETYPGRDPYTQVYGRNRSAPITEMSINDVLTYQGELRAAGSPSSAVGAYQFMPNTLRWLVNNMGLTGDEIMTPQLQDEMAVALMERRGLSRFLSGDLSAEDFQNNLAMEWAGLPTTSGLSYYAGDGLNAATVGTSDAQQALLALVSPTSTAQTEQGSSGVRLRDRLASWHGPEHIDNLDPTFVSSLEQLIAAAPPEIAPHLGVLSGYRSVERQAELFEEAVLRYGSEAAARRHVAPPGRSQHNHGRAVDLMYRGRSLAHAPPEVVEWVHENAEAYGLWFPLGHEPWHVEPIGSRDRQTSSTDQTLLDARANRQQAFKAEGRRQSDNFEDRRSEVKPWNYSPDETIRAYDSEGNLVVITPGSMEREWFDQAVRELERSLRPSDDPSAVSSRDVFGSTGSERDLFEQILLQISSRRRWMFEAEAERSRER